VARTLFFADRRLAGRIGADDCAKRFFYNAIFFTFCPRVLTDSTESHAEPDRMVHSPLRGGNFLALPASYAISIRLGRRAMMTLDLRVSGVLLALSGYLFRSGVESRHTQTIAVVIFPFLASPAASLRISRQLNFPLEFGPLAIALSMPLGTGNWRPSPGPAFVRGV